MSAARVCESCGADISHRAPQAKLCDSSCRKRKPCARCGRPKGPSVQGGKYCQPCREVTVLDATGQHQREITRRSAKRRRVAAIESGDITPRAVKVRDDGMVWCGRCADYLPATSFPKRTGPRASAYCIPCQRTYYHERRLRNLYGLTWDEYDALLASQDYRCAICRGKPRKNVLAVDHNHTTGEIRGLLCSKCNHKLLGSANDDPARLRAAADYLEANAPRQVLGGIRLVPGSTSQESA